jgi:DNA mismatch endonuclease (patch repair protein)
MTDVHSPEQRSRNMAAIRSINTKPEIKVRSVLHHLGYRFRLHRKDLPGTPDIVLPKLRTVIFVHGCFWHRHDCAKGNKRSATRQEFWNTKLEGNVERDRRHRAALLSLGWRVIELWECETGDLDELEFKLKHLFSQTSGSAI